MAPLTVLTRPRRAFAQAAAKPSLRTGSTIVILTGIACLVLEVIGAVIARSGAQAIIFSVATPFLLAAFWLISGLLVGAGARLMGWEPRRRRLLAVTGLTFPVLVAYALIGLVQAASTHLGGATVSAAAGLLALPVIAWFVALNAVAVTAVYEGSPMAATAIALLPYAALSGVLLLLVLVLSLLHAVGVV